MTASLITTVCIRLLHVGSAIALLGGMTHSQIAGGDDQRYKRLYRLGGLLMLLSGIWQFVTGMAGAPTAWHIIAGIKVLLGLHVIAVAFALARGTREPERLARMRRGALASGWIVVILGVVLRNLPR